MDAFTPRLPHGGLRTPFKGFDMSSLPRTAHRNAVMTDVRNVLMVLLLIPGLLANCSTSCGFRLLADRLPNCLFRRFNADFHTDIVSGFTRCSASARNASVIASTASSFFGSVLVLAEDIRR